MKLIKKLGVFRANGRSFTKALYKCECGNEVALPLSEGKRQKHCGVTCPKNKYRKKEGKYNPMQYFP